MSITTKSISLVFVTDINKLEQNIQLENTPASKLKYKNLSYQIDNNSALKGEYWKLEDPAREEAIVTECKFKNGFSILGTIERASVTYRIVSKAKDRRAAIPSVGKLIYEMIQNEKFDINKIGVNFIIEADLTDAKNTIKNLLNPSVSSLNSKPGTFDIVYHFPNGEGNTLNLKLFLSEETPDVLYIDGNFHFEMTTNISREQVIEIIESVNAKEQELLGLLENFSSEIA